MVWWLSLSPESYLFTLLLLLACADKLDPPLLDSVIAHDSHFIVTFAHACLLPDIRYTIVSNPPCPALAQNTFVSPITVAGFPRNTGTSASFPVLESFSLVAYSLAVVAHDCGRSSQPSNFSPAMNPRQSLVMLSSVSYIFFILFSSFFLLAFRLLCNITLSFHVLRNT